MYIPIGKRVLISPIEAANKTESGLVMENSSNTASLPVKGEVLEVGELSQFKKGDIVLFRRFSVDMLTMVTPKGEITVNVVDDEDILCKQVEI